jgi:sialate O-acetylesterase
MRGQSISHGVSSTRQALRARPRSQTRFASLLGLALAMVAGDRSELDASTKNSLPAQATSASLELAPLELPAVFSDGMVLQRGPRAPIWGRAQAGERVELRLLASDGSAASETHAIADRDGAWRAAFFDLSAGGPYSLVVRGTDSANRERVIKDVLVGEVWLGSGQSNMHMSAAGCERYEEAKAFAELPQMRVFRENSLASGTPQWAGSGEWVRCSPSTFGDFSGVLFWFGVELGAELDVPIGFLDSSLGGSRIENWTSAEAQFASPELASFAAARDAEYWGFDQSAFLTAFRPVREQWQIQAEAAAVRGERAPDRPRNRAEGRLRHGSVGYLFNGKIAPLVGYGLRGFLWYQGEDNVLRASYYGAQLQLLVSDWRERWGEGELPFCWVQLPNFADGRVEAEWALVREGMRRALCMPNTGMIVAIDLGLPHDIHPTNKPAIGHRLAGWALSEVYARPRAWSSSLFTGHVVRGRRVLVCLSPTYGQLAPLDRDLPGFELAGSDGVWHAARARVVVRSTPCVILESSEVAEPVDVRYAWASDPTIELVNGANLPVSPFSTRL